MLQSQGPIKGSYLGSYFNQAGEIPLLTSPVLLVLMLKLYGGKMKKNSTLHFEDFDLDLEDEKEDEDEKAGMNGRSICSVEMCTHSHGPRVLPPSHIPPQDL